MYPEALKKSFGRSRVDTTMFASSPATSMCVPYGEIGWACQTKPSSLKTCAETVGEEGGPTSQAVTVESILDKKSNANVDDIRRLCPSPTTHERVPMPTALARRGWMAKHPQPEIHGIAPSLFIDAFVTDTTHIHLPVIKPYPRLALHR